MRSDQRYKLILEFGTLAGLVAWVDAARENGDVPYGADAFKADGLDATHGGGAHTYITADLADRPPALAAREALTGQELAEARDRAERIAEQAKFAKFAADVAAGRFGEVR